MDLSGANCIPGVGDSLIWPIQGRATVQVWFLASLP